MIFSYGYGWWQNWWWWTNARPLLAISMFTAVRRSKTDGIAHWVMSRATREATGCRHWVTTYSVLPQRPPGQQQIKWWLNNGPSLLAILMAVAVRRYNTACIAQWRRSRALVKATGCCHWARSAADRCNWSRICHFVFCFFVLNSLKKVAV